MVYTEELGYGYLRLSHSSSPAALLTDQERSALPDMVTLSLFSGATATVRKELLKSKVPVRIKSFHGTRKIYTLHIPPDKTVGDLKDMLLKADTEGDLKGFIQIGLYCPIVLFLFTTKGKAARVGYLRQNRGLRNYTQNLTNPHGRQTLHLGFLPQRQRYRCTPLLHLSLRTTI